MNRIILVSYIYTPTICLECEWKCVHPPVSSCRFMCYRRTAKWKIFQNICENTKWFTANYLFTFFFSETKKNHPNCIHLNNKQNAIYFRSAFRFYFVNGLYLIALFIFLSFFLQKYARRLCGRQRSMPRHKTSTQIRLFFRLWMSSCAYHINLCDVLNCWTKDTTFDFEQIIFCCVVLSFCKQCVMDTTASK